MACPIGNAAAIPIGKFFRSVGYCRQAPHKRIDKVIRNNALTCHQLTTRIKIFFL
jgi:hypothetical protein